MKRVLTAMIGAALVATTASAAQASTIANLRSTAYGHPRAEWVQQYAQYLFGDSASPLLSDSCGSFVGRAFFLAPPSDEGQEFECEVPEGMPIFIGHALYFAWKGDAPTRAGLVTYAQEQFQPSGSSVIFDDVAVRLRTTQTGTFDVLSAPGSLYDSVIELGTGPIPTAVVGQFTILRPPPRGAHVLSVSVDFSAAGGGVFSATYTIHVGPPLPGLGG